MGILDTILGTGQGTGDPKATPGQPYQPGMLGGLQAYLAPGMYQARQQGFAQQQAYDALRGSGKAPDDMAGALATNPQMMQQAGGAYLPSAPSLGQGAFGEQFQQKTLPGGNIQLSQPLQPGQTTPPGTTPVPPGAAQPQGMPGKPLGSTSAIADAIQQAQAQGATREQLLQYVPIGGRDTVAAVLAGRQDPKELSMRQEDRDLVIKYAHLIDKDFDENRAQAVNTYRKGYMNTATQGSLGFKREALGTTFEHLNSTLDAALALHNVSGGFAPAAWLSNKINQLGTSNKALATAFDTKTDLLADETAKFITGKAPAEGHAKEYKDKWDVGADPRVTAATAAAYLDMVEGKIAEMERERDANFKNDPNTISQFPIELAQHKAMAQQIRAKIQALRGQDGEGTQGLPPGVTVKKLN